MALEYLLKVAVVVIIWLLGLRISWIAEAFIMLEVFASWVFPPLWVVYFAQLHKLSISG